MYTGQIHWPVFLTEIYTHQGPFFYTRQIH